MAYEEPYDKSVKKEIEEEITIKRDEKKPWSDYNDLRKGPTMSVEEFIERVQLLAQVKLKYAAFLSILYLTGARVQEICRYKYQGSHPEKREMKNLMHLPSIQLKDIFVEHDEVNDVDWLVINTRIEKKPISEKAYRSTYILYSKVEENYVWPLVEILDSYLEVNFTGASPDTPIFDIGIFLSWQIAKKYLGLTPHVIRGMRAKHLVRRNGFDVTALKAFFHWKDATIATEYAASETSDIKRRLLGKL